MQTFSNLWKINENTFTESQYEELKNVCGVEKCKFLTLNSTYKELKKLKKFISYIS